MFDYFCPNCKQIAPKNQKDMWCKNCGGYLKGESPGITGTRDNFGIKNEFIDEQSREVIDNWKKWERAGYKDLGAMKSNNLKEQVKEKIDRRKNRRDKITDIRNLPL